MLTAGTQIQLDGEGRCCLIDDLNIGEHIFNPFPERTCEVIDILTRTVNLASSEDPWVPIEIPKGVITSGRPYAPLLVSARQMIMVKSENSILKKPELKIIAAKDFSYAHPVWRKEITYSAVFLEIVQPFVANGVACLSFSNDVYNN